MFCPGCGKEITNDTKCECGFTFNEQIKEIIQKKQTTIKDNDNLFKYIILCYLGPLVLLSINKLWNTKNAIHVKRGIILNSLAILSILLIYIYEPLIFGMVVIAAFYLFSMVSGIIGVIADKEIDNGILDKICGVVFKKKK